MIYVIYNNNLPDLSFYSKELELILSDNNNTFLTSKGNEYMILLLPIFIRKNQHKIAELLV